MSEAVNFCDGEFPIHHAQVGNETCHMCGLPFAVPVERLAKMRKRLAELHAHAMRERLGIHSANCNPNNCVYAYEVAR